MNFTVNTEVCTRCGLCTLECPTALLEMSEEGPKAGRGGCLRCGHCVAVCPTGAIDYDITPRSEMKSIESYPFTPEEGEIFLRSRRSIRCYRRKSVRAEDIRRILSVARMAPTATNSQGISFRVIRDPERLKAISTTVLDWMQEASKHHARMRLYARGAKKFTERGMDFILHDAPVLIVAVATMSDKERGRDNGHFSLSYAELFAPTLGLGSCWAGFVEHCGQYGWEPLNELLGLQEGEYVSGAIVMGYPQFKYRYMVERNPLSITFDRED